MALAGQTDTCPGVRCANVWSSELSGAELERYVEIMIEGQGQSEGEIIEKPKRRR